MDATFYKYAKEGVFKTCSLSWILYLNRFNDGAVIDCCSYFWDTNIKF